MIESHEVRVLTVDGPSGAGKGTLCHLLARRHNWNYMDSGCLYRLLAFNALHEGVSLNDTKSLISLAAGLDVQFVFSSRGDCLVMSAGQDRGIELRSEQVGFAASTIAACPEVRMALLERQRQFRSPPGLVADGRDMGTVVFPDADLKIYLTATREARIRRRYIQLKEQGLIAKINGITQSLSQRDERDGCRSVAPLRPAKDAVIIENTRLGIEEVYAKVIELARDSGLFD